MRVFVPAYVLRASIYVYIYLHVSAHKGLLTSFLNLQPRSLASTKQKKPAKPRWENFAIPQGSVVYKRAQSSVLLSSSVWRIQCTPLGL